MKFIFIFILTLIIFCQCSNSSEIKYEGSIPVKSTCQLQYETLNDSFMFSWPRDIIIIDSLLIVHDSYKQSNCFHIFNKNTGVLLKSFGKKGRGPGELLEISSVNYNHDRRSITTFDPNTKKIVIFDIINILDGVKPTFQDLIIEGSPNFIKQILPYGNEYIAKGNNDKMRYGVWNSSQNLFSNLYVDYPALSEDEETNWSLTDYSVKVRLSPNGQKLVTGTYIGGVLEVFNVDKRHITPFSINYFFEPHYAYAHGAIPKWVTTVAETKIGFEDIFLNNEYIYGLIWEIEKSSMEEHRPSIIQFDYNGTPICRYETNITLESFAVDDDNTIYAIGYNEGQYSMNKYINKN